MKTINSRSTLFLTLAIAASTPGAWAAEAETATIDKGGAQLEFKVGESRNDRDADFSTRVRTTPFLARIGIASNAEIRIETEGRAKVTEKLRRTGQQASISGNADTSIGARWRPYDADEKTGAPAIAGVLVFGLPTGSKNFKGDGVSTNLKIAAEWALGKDASIGVMPGIVREKNVDGKWYAAPTFAVTLGKNWTPAWRSTVELVSPRLTSKKNGGNEATFNFGNTYSLNDNFELELVYLRGLTNETAENSILFGVNIKF
jgi:Putative MetA-pathway of phenol degradation